MRKDVEYGTDGTRKAGRRADGAHGGAYKSQVLLRRDDVTVNAKSLMGLVSLRLQEDAAVTIIAIGEDEAQAVCEMSRRLGN